MHQRMRWTRQQPLAQAMAGAGKAAAICVMTGATAAMLSFGAAAAAERPAQGVPIVLWPDGAPNAIGKEDVDIPTLTPYWPAQPAATGTAVIVCPGGSYTHLAMDHEGEQPARWFNALGVPAFVLKYRLGPRYHHPTMLWDAQRAIRYVRAHAAEFNTRPDRIGIMGFSAGGHLAATTGTHFEPGKADAPDPIDRGDPRPDFLILGYPVISLTESFTHKSSRENLLGTSPDPKLVELLSNERQVTNRTPPTFIFHTDDDSGVPVENSLAFYLALKKAGVPGEMHIYAHGKHGVGLAQTDPVLSTWPARLADWLRVRGLLPDATAPAAASPQR
jgi:acetyl esterase/lipase